MISRCAHPRIVFHTLVSDFRLFLGLMGCPRRYERQQDWYSVASNICTKPPQTLTTYYDHYHYYYYTTTTTTTTTTTNY
ncbi:hypothetical protein DPMN_036061 [Dreissena polymorpha]|uniref:Uncharacterized protein n=1 Tax=Dreissena polymorpha TaxID=45954 RepID=A0A9D4MAA5_DREPO|nr:hypothetical protein DPMN_036061 [Dreissena polymorpha]